VDKAAAALRNGDPKAALKWLRSITSRDRPASLEAEIRYAIAMIAAAAGDGGRCEPACFFAQ
jgi:hypothetical protein